jgi:hypothetical protein
MQKRYSLAILEPVNNRKGRAFDMAFGDAIVSEDN